MLSKNISTNIASINEIMEENERSVRFKCRLHPKYLRDILEKKSVIDLKELQ